MKIAKIVVGLFLIFAAFQGKPEGMTYGELNGGALFGFISMLVIGISLVIWGLASGKKEKPEN